MNDTTFDENRTDAMLLAAEQLNPSRSGQEMVLHSPAAAMPATAAVFAEPIVTAQPCSIRRNIPDFLNRMKVLARMAGEEYRYSFPVKSKSGKNTTVEGGSIKLANDLVREYGNCMVDARVVETPNHFIIYARFVDFETGFCDTRPFMQRKGQKTMNTDADRAADIVFQIGMSKAKRNVVLNALQTYADFTYAEAKSSIVEQIGKQLPHWREKMARGIAEKKYDLARIEQQVGRPLAEWLAVDIARVVAELKSIGDGMASFDDLYPGQNPASSDELNQEFLNGGAEAKPVEPEQQKPTDNTAEHQSMKGGETTTDAARTQAMKEEVEIGRAHV